MEMIEVLRRAVQAKASDIHLVIGKPAMMRLDGKIVEVSGCPVLSSEAAKKMVYSILNEDQRTRFEKDWELDCSFSARDIARFRVNVLLQNNGVEAVLRIISSKIPTPEELGLPPALLGLADLPRGLVLVTGPTGSGKTTTLACFMELINQKRTDHILTIEDPIEFVYESKKSIFRQREVGQQTKSFAEGLKHALRQDPDVILVGEMRNLETISLAVTAAETGHLCFGTLHTQDAPSTVDRIIDVFPQYQQTQIRVQLAATLKAVVSQILLPRKDGNGRIAAREVMIVTPAISNLIREGKSHMLYGAIETGAKFGMISMDRALVDLTRQGLVKLEDAIGAAHNPEVFKAITATTPTGHVTHAR